MLDMDLNINLTIFLENRNPLLKKDLIGKKLLLRNDLCENYFISLSFGIELGMHAYMYIGFLV
jgi:hypothetical protein